MKNNWQIIQGDAIREVKKIPSVSIDCVITSPPYWQMRNYGWKGQWGLERSYQAYLENLWRLMDEIMRVLKSKGTVWINLGDTYFGSGNGSGQHGKINLRSEQFEKVVPGKPNNHASNALRKKCQVLIPHRFAIGCIERGWIVRNDIIWAKPNGVPESVKDRFSKRHEYIFFMVKNSDYYFDLDVIRQPHKESSLERIKYAMTAYAGDKKNPKGAFGKGNINGGAVKKVKLNPRGKNPGDVSDFWAVSTKRGAVGHYATFNTELIEKPVLAGCPKGGIILDPFCGTATTGVKALQLGRKFIGIDGKKQYCEIARKHLSQANNVSANDLKKIKQSLKKLDFAA
jgi:DNA modification methylase